MMMQNGMKVDIKIQSLIDVITNSSTSVFTIYSRQNIDDIKELVNAILAIDGNYTFDDLFDIKLLIDSDQAEFIWESDDKFSQEFPEFEDFYEYLENASDDELDKYEDILDDLQDCYDHFSLYDGFSITLKEEVKDSEVVKQAAKLINRIDIIFDHDITSC